MPVNALPYGSTDLIKRGPASGSDRLSLLAIFSWFRAACAAVWPRRIGLCVGCAALALAVASCERTDFYPASNVYYKPWTGVVQVARQPPPRYIELGVVVAHGGSAATDRSLIQQLKERAAGIGATAVVITQDKTVTGHDVLGMPQYEMSGLAIRTVR
jgi:hypothetical protein